MSPRYHILEDSTFQCLKWQFIFPPTYDKTQNSKQKEESVQDVTVFVNDMAVKGFKMTKNDGTALSGNSLGSFHVFFFFFKPVIWAHKQHNNSGMLKSLLPQNTLSLDFNDWGRHSSTFIIIFKCVLTHIITNSDGFNHHFIIINNKRLW